MDYDGEPVDKGLCLPLPHLSPDLDVGESQDTLSEAHVLARECRVVPCRDCDDRGLDHEGDDCWLRCVFSITSSPP